MPTLNAPTLFPIPPDGTPVTLTRSFVTDIMHGRDGTEIRQAERDVWLRKLEYSAAFVNAAEAGLFRSLWYTAPEPLRFRVPLWREGSTPTSIAGAVVTTDTTNREFVTGANAAILWQDNGDG